jgi:hypothetical protein
MPPTAADPAVVHYRAASGHLITARGKIHQAAGKDENW